MRNTLAMLLIATTSVATPAAAQNDAPAEVMVLGTFHFHKVSDSTTILAPERQAQIRAVVRSLAEFRPTKTAVEEIRADADRLDSLYTAYRSGRHEITRNERQQLGFRLADRLGHERLYSIDYKHDWPMESVVDHAEKHQPWFTDYWEDWMDWAEEMALQVPDDVSISERLRMWNHPDTLALMHGRYMRAAEVGTDSGYVGANFVAEWYRRNIYIFANLTGIANPGDRIIVIIGSGHAPTLRRFVAAHPRMKLIDPLDYLPAGSAAATRSPREHAGFDGDSSTWPWSVPASSEQKQWRRK